MISARTKAALAAAKERGVTLGNPRLAEARIKAEIGKAAAADAFAKSVAPVIRAIQGSGITSLRGVARELVARKVPTTRGGQWTPVQVGDLLSVHQRQPEFAARFCLAGKGDQKEQVARTSPGALVDEIKSTLDPVARASEQRKAGG